MAGCSDPGSVTGMVSCGLPRKVAYSEADCSLVPCGSDGEECVLGFVGLTTVCSAHVEGEEQTDVVMFVCGHTPLSCFEHCACLYPYVCRCLSSRVCTCYETCANEFDSEAPVSTCWRWCCMYT